MALELPRLLVTFDDGTEIEVQSKLRDMACAERDYKTDFEKASGLQGMYATALAALTRMKRQGLIVIDVPATMDEFLDLADIEPVTDADDSVGKVSVPAPTTG